MFDFDPETDLSPVDEAIFDLLAANPDNAFTGHEIGELSGLSLQAAEQSLMRLEELGVAIRGECWGDMRVTLSQKWTDRIRARLAQTDDEPDDDDNETEVEAEHAGGQKIRTYVYDGHQAIQACKRQAVAAGEDLSNRTYLYRDERGDWTEAD